MFAFSTTRCERLGWLALLALAAGCHALVHIPDETLESLLTPVETSPESVTLEIFQARVPSDAEGQVAPLWNQIDELMLPADVRRRLTCNGFRSGVIGGPIPEELASLLDLEDESAEVQAERLITEKSAAPRITRRVVQLRNGEPTQIKPSEVADELHVLYCDDHGLTGSAYSRAEGVYELRASASPGQQVAIELLPELHHGEVRNRYVGSDPGIFLMTPSRERERYDQLRMSVQLSPGEFLVLGGIREAPGSLGQVFHTDRKTGAEQQKLIVIRMLEIPATEILAE